MDARRPDFDNFAYEWYCGCFPPGPGVPVERRSSDRYRETSELRMKRIVIVDDSPTIRRMVRASLADIGAVTFSDAGSGLEAIEQLTLGPVALMVLDLNMPDMHGIDVLKFVRRHPGSRALPVLVL